MNCHKTNLKTNHYRVFYRGLVLFADHNAYDGG